MCGFVGILKKNGSSPESLILNRMASTINHRGPDEEGEFIEGPVGFFHKRLSIIDLSTGSQPMSFEDCTIVYNGEIYNYIELRDELKKKGHQFASTSDTEVILHLYKEYGPDFTGMLNGMFAFIIFDKGKNRLFIARDHFGIKPLYWYSDSDQILFGSEIKAILAFPGLRAEPETTSLYEYLTFQFIMGESTMFQNISKVPPGHQMIIDISTGSISIKKYWTPDFTLDPYHTEEYFIAELRKILEETILQQLRSDVPHWDILKRWAGFFIGNNFGLTVPRQAHQIIYRGLSRGS
jgi:asparagine synthase (glutamine-hydrolysing)